MLGRRSAIKGRTAAERRSLAREADEIYRRKMKADGVPSTREFADVLSYEVLRSNKQDTAESIVKRACETMLLAVTTDGKTEKPKWTREGIRKRYQYCYEQVALARAASKAAAEKAKVDV